MSKPNPALSGAHRKQELNKEERAYFSKLHKSAYYLEFAGLSFNDGDSGPLAKALKQLGEIQLKSKSGKNLAKLYQNYKAKGLNSESPVIRRVFIGQLLMRLKSQKSAPGLVPFMKLMVKETKSLQPILTKHIVDLIKVLQSMPQSKARDAKIKQLLEWIGVPSSGPEDARPVDPFFGTVDDEREGGKGGTTTGYGPLEGISPLASGNEIMDISKLDPFQIIFLKQMIYGYNQYVETLRMLFKKLNSLNVKPVSVIRFKRQVRKTFGALESWMVKTVQMMGVSKGKQLPSIYKKRIEEIKFPSLPTKIDIGDKVLEFFINKFTTKLNISTNFRSYLESQVKKQFKNAIPAIQLISKYIGPFKDILSRKKMYKTGSNRAFLNRFWNLAYRKFKGSSGNEKTKFEFIAMILDSIKDDNELVKLSAKLRPILMELLKGSGDAKKLAKQYFGKSFADLTQLEINSILSLLLPSQQTTPQIKNSKGYKAMKKELMLLFEGAEIKKLKKENYLAYVAITTVAQNILNIAGSLASEKDPAKIEQKIKFFKAAFESIKKLLGKKGLRLVKQENARAAEFLENPNNEIVRIMSQNRPTLIAFLKNSPEVNKFVQSHFGRAVKDLKPNEIEAIIKLLLPSQVTKPKDYNTQAYKDLKGKLEKMLKSAGLDEIQQKNYIAGLAINTAKQNMLNIYASLVNEKNSKQAKQKINKFINGFEAIRKLIGLKGITEIKKRNPQLAYLIQNPKLAIFLIKYKGGANVDRAITRFEKLHQLKRPAVVTAVLRSAIKIKKDLVKRRKEYLQQIVTTKTIRGKKHTIYNETYGKLVRRLETDILKIDVVISDLEITWDEKDFKKKEAQIKKLLFSTRYLNITPKLQQYISLSVETAAQKQKPDYNSLFFISSIINRNISAQLRKICKTKNCEFAYPRLAKVLRQVILTFGQQEQAKLGKMSAYKYLSENFARFNKELGKRVDAILKQTKFTDTKDTKDKNVYFLGSIGNYIGKVLKKYVMHKSRRAAPKRA